MPSFCLFDSYTCDKLNTMKNMNEKIENAMLLEIQARGFAAPVDVLLDIGFLDTKKYQNWRNGRVPCLEAVCTANLQKHSEVLSVMRKLANQNGWKTSVTDYRQWGAKSCRVLRFSKSGNPVLEKLYATH